MIKHFWICHKKAWFVLSVVIIMVILGCTSPAFAQNPAQEKYDAAIVHYKWGDYDKAVVFFEEFLALYPASDLADDTQYMLGQCYVRLERGDDAIFAFYTAAYKFPRGNSQEDALYALASVLYRQDYMPQALDAYEQLVAKYPGSRHAAYAQTCIGWLYGSMGNVEKAKAELRKVAINYPDSPYVETARESLKMLGATTDSKKLSSTSDTGTADGQVDSVYILNQKPEGTQLVSVKHFPGETEEIYVWFLYKGFESGDVLSGIWTDIGRQLHLKAVPVIVTSNQGEAGFALRRPVNGWARGNYQVEIKQGEKVLNEANFNIED